MFKSSLIYIHFIKNMSEKKQVFVMRVLIVVFIAISVILAIVQYKQNVTFIAQLMGVSWGALAGAFLAPFIYGLYWKKASRIAVWSSFIFGSGIMLLNMLPGDPSVSHQLWSFCNADGSCDRSGGQFVHSETGIQTG